MTKPDTAFNLGRAWARFAPRNTELAKTVPALSESPDSIARYVQTQVEAQLLQVDAQYYDKNEGGSASYDAAIRDYIAYLLTELHLYTVYVAALHASHTTPGGVDTHDNLTKVLDTLEQQTH